MRIIGGEIRSRRLKSLPGLDTRPTPDRLRETLFDILGPRVQDAVFADLYAGTGAVGIEALSRGARKAIFVESSRAAAAVLRENLRSFGLEARAELHVGRVRAIQADIVFADPPYPLTAAYETVLASASAPLVILQHDRRMKPLSRAPARSVRQGDNVLSFFENIEGAGA